MYNIHIKVPTSLLDELKRNEIVKAITNFENSYSTEAYKILSEISKFNNFFFGILDNNCNNKEYIMSMSSSNNSVYLELQLDESECFIHDYYTFTDLIYYLDCEPDEKIANECKLALKNKLKEDYINSSNTIQVIFPTIKLSQVVNIY